MSSKNDVAGEGIDAETNKHLEETLGMSLMTQKKLLISFEEIKFEEMIPRETLERSAECQGWCYNSCLK